MKAERPLFTVLRIITILFLKWNIKVKTNNYVTELKVITFFLDYSSVDSSLSDTSYWVFCVAVTLEACILEVPSSNIGVFADI